MRSLAHSDCYVSDRFACSSIFFGTPLPRRTSKFTFRTTDSAIARVGDREKSNKILKLLLIHVHPNAPPPLRLNRSHRLRCQIHTRAAGPRKSKLYPPSFRIQSFQTLQDKSTDRHPYVQQPQNPIHISRVRFRDNTAADDAVVAFSVKEELVSEFVYREESFVARRLVCQQEIRAGPLLLTSDVESPPPRTPAYVHSQ